nr:putative uncharacterized protein DDB_G0290521 [Procambarus clarkii]
MSIPVDLLQPQPASEPTTRTVPRPSATASRFTNKKQTKSTGQRSSPQTPPPKKQRRRSSPHSWTALQQRRPAETETSTMEPVQTTTPTTSGIPTGTPTETAPQAPTPMTQTPAIAAAQQASAPDTELEELEELEVTYIHPIPLAIPGIPDRSKPCYCLFIDQEVVFNGNSTTRKALCHRM